MAFIFGGNTGRSYEDLKRRQLMAEALLQQSSRTPRNVGEGLTAIGNALAGRVIEARTNKKMEEGRKGASEALTALLTGQGGFAPADTAGTPKAPPIAPPASPDVKAPGTFLDYVAMKEGTEGHPKARGYNTTLDYGRWTGGPIKLTGMTLDEIDALQTRMLADPENLAKYKGPGGLSGSSALGRYQIVRKTLRGLREKLGLSGDTKFTPELQDMLARELATARGRDAAGLSSEWAGLKRADAADILTAYDRGFGTPDTPPAPETPETPAPGGISPRMAQLLSVANNEFLDPNQRRIVDMLIQQEMQRNTPPDPFKVAGLEMDQRRLALAEAEAKRKAEMDARRFALDTAKFETRNEMSDAERASADLDARTFEADRSDAAAAAKLAEEKAALERERFNASTEKDRAAIELRTRELERKERELQARIDGKLKTGDTINIGDNGQKFPDPEKGYVYQRNEDGSVKIFEDGLPRMVPIPGGSADRKEAAAEEAAGKKVENSIGKTALVLEDIDRAIGSAEDSEFSTGLPGQVLGDIGGTGAHDLRSTIDTVRANIGFDRLNQMREESPTGGALGQVTEREMKFLQSVMGNLETSQTKEQLIRNLQRLRTHYIDIMRKFAAYPSLAGDKSLDPYREGGAYFESSAPKLDRPDGMGVEFYNKLTSGGVDPGERDKIIMAWPSLSEEHREYFRKKIMGEN